MATTTATATVNAGSKDQWHKAFRHISKADAPTLISTAGAATYTAAQVLAGLLLRDPASASRTDVLPTAALLVAALRGEEIGDVIRCKIINCADAAEVISLTAGSGGALSTDVPAGNFDIAQNITKEIFIRLTGVVAGSEAYVVYA